MKHLIWVGLLLASLARGQIPYNAFPNLPGNLNGTERVLVNVGADSLYLTTTEAIAALNQQGSILPQQYGGTGANSLANAGIPVITGSITALQCVYWVTTVTVGSLPCPTGGNVSSSGSPLIGQLTAWTSPTTISNANLSGDCSTSNNLSLICTSTNGTPFGTFVTQNYQSPPPIGGTTPAAGNFTTMVLTGQLTIDVLGSTQCLHVNASGVVTGTGSDCGTGSGSGTWSGLTTGTGTNTNLAAVCGTGCALSTSGTGTIAATSLISLTGLPGVNTATVMSQITGTNGNPPSANTLPNFQAAMVAATAITIADSPASGPLNDYTASSQLTSNTAIMYLTPASGGTTINGMLAGTNNQEIFIINAEAAGGSDNIYLVNQSSSDTTAANRYLTAATTKLGIVPGGAVICVYLAPTSPTINRWMCH